MNWLSTRMTTYWLPSNLTKWNGVSRKYHYPIHQFKWPPNELLDIFICHHKIYGFQDTMRNLKCISLAFQINGNTMLLFGIYFRLVLLKNRSGLTVSCERFVYFAVSKFSMFLTDVLVSD